MYADATQPLMRIWTSADRCKRYVLEAYKEKHGEREGRLALQYREVVEWAGGNKSTDAGIQHVGPCMLHPPDVAHWSSLLMLPATLDADTRVTFARRFSRTQALVAFDAFAWLPPTLRHQLVVPLSTVVMEEKEEAEEGGGGRRGGEGDGGESDEETRLQQCRALGADVESAMGGEKRRRDVMVDVLEYLEREIARMEHKRRK